jgi:heme/copper-type cytochrome/quinol oxidase subunit 2
MRSHSPVLSLLAAACPAAPCRAAGVLDPQGPVAAAERLILLNATAIMLVVVLPVIVLTLAFAWWYRASNTRAAYQPDWSYSGPIELVTWSIPAMVVILLGAVGWIGSHQLDPARKLQSDSKPIRIEVVSLDWKWLYPGLSANFSGDGFSDMRFLVHAVPATDFDHWLARTREAGPALDADAYSQLARPNSNADARTYGSVDPNLFQRIVMPAAQPAAAPGMEH